MWQKIQQIFGFNRSPLLIIPAILASTTLHFNLTLDISKIISFLIMKFQRTLILIDSSININFRAKITKKLAKQMSTTRRSNM